MRLTRIGIMALSLSLFPYPGVADPVISKTYSYFNISGRTGAELERELTLRGPMLEQTGTRHPGATRIKLGGSVKYEKLDGRCRVIGTEVKLETHLTLPRWKNRASADKDTRLIWDTLSSDIKRHEERHAEIARQHARKMEKALEALRPQKTCEKMKARVDATTKSIIEKHAADQARFDRVEAASFERRMLRMLRFKAEKRHKGG
ncbi:DUF922 domain-containing Zn-dependent protease [Hoeflea ulvae]|uniref:DUF922 domain-containing protein n=1 Tax=Hoeflea ulvae TaxID=2983764 RepID=A0ABT3YHZ4_9HYPH|nr:DUF922 domain-containing protein [Hoeflea ulvae]MCY0095433.1 DUF922 domain-containing protein [Hoeflea ulvae]